MNPGSLMFLIHEGWLNMRRHGLMTLAALGTVTLSLTVFGACLWTGIRVNEIVQDQPQKLNEIDLFLHGSVSRKDAIKLQSDIQEIHQVASVHLVTKEAAWAQLQNQDPTLTRAVSGNPLMDKLQVNAKDGAEVHSLSSFFKDKKRFPQILQVNDSNTEISALLAFERLIRTLGTAAAIALFAATLFIVQNTIRLTVFTRRREIGIMKIVGATSGFIRLPLLVEGIFHGVVGGLLAGIVLAAAAEQVSRFIGSLHSPLIENVPSQLNALSITFILILTGMVVGIVGSELAMRRFLRQTL